MRRAFTVSIEPVAKGRPRAFGNRMVTPAKTRKYEAAFAQLAADCEPRAPIEGAIAITLTFYLKRPKRLMRKKDPSGRLPCDRRPDLDNLVKAAMDALKRWWRDDAQIANITASKFYTEKDGLPRVEVVVDDEEN